LKKKFSRVNTNTLFALSLLIFFSPYFRSSAVWLTNDNLALLFFVLSINKYVHFTEVQNKKFQNFILCLFFLILASYIRQNYAIFSVFYFVKAFNIFSKKEVLYAFIFCLFLSIPEFIFLKYMYSSKNFYSSELILRADYFLNLLAFLTIYFFYIFPIFLSQNMWIQLFNFYKRNYIITFLIISLFLFYLSNYNIPQSAFTFGNGVFFKISNILEIKFIIYIISLLSIILIIFYNENKIENFILLICVFYMNPWFVIFQKYFDPMLSIIFFTLINSDFISKNIIQEKLNLKILYIFNISFLIFANYYYILIK